MDCQAIFAFNAMIYMADTVGKDNRKLTPSEQLLAAYQAQNWMPA